MCWHEGNPALQEGKEAMWLISAKNALAIIGLIVVALVAGTACQEEPQFRTTALVTRATRGDDGNYTVWAQCEVTNTGDAAEVTVLATLDPATGFFGFNEGDILNASKIVSIPANSSKIVTFSFPGAEPIAQDFVGEFQGNIWAGHDASCSIE
jgi:hypothetical protein